MMAIALHSVETQHGRVAQFLRLHLLLNKCGLANRNMTNLDQVLFIENVSNARLNIGQQTIRMVKIEPNAVCYWGSIHFSIVENDELISRAEVIQVELEHSEQIYKVCGISNVLTLPQFRGKGYGKQIVKAATDYILRSDVDIGLLFCEPRLESFYASNGWETQSNSVTRIGSSTNYQEYASIRMILLVSDKGKNLCADFENSPMYFQRIW